MSAGARTFQGRPATTPAASWTQSESIWQIPPRQPPPPPPLGAVLKTEVGKSMNEPSSRLDPVWSLAAFPGQPDRLTKLPAEPINKIWLEVTTSSPNIGPICKALLPSQRRNYTSPHPQLSHRLSSAPSPR